MTTKAMDNKPVIDEIQGNHKNDIGESDLHETNHHYTQARMLTILALSKLAEYRDDETGDHLERIREYTKLIAKEMAKKSNFMGYITNEYIDDIYHSSILHDIGKVGVPDTILLKLGKLTDAEFEVIKRHTLFGGDVLKDIEAQVEGQTFLTLGKEIAYFHHERWDGTGYPQGRHGEQIPLSARIVALPDVYDALTSRRVYKRRNTPEEAKDIIIKEKGKHFDPDVVDSFTACEDDFNKVYKEQHGGWLKYK
ncbi:MAG: HD domain-containing protein [Desulfobacterales bacterium]|nr:MAG: HD domain-containing protein [Desulfobacterales bacterium]